MEKISLKDFKIAYNYVLIKPDPDFEFIEVKQNSAFLSAIEQPKIWLGYNSETHGRHFGITGKILAVPENFIYNKEEIVKFKEHVGSLWNYGDQLIISDLMRESNEIDTEIEVEIGDKVWFSYLCQLNGVVKELLIDTVEHGMCFLARYEELYCRERAGELELVNGWVWIERLERENVAESGFELHLSNKHRYQNGRARVIKTARPLRGFIDGGSDTDIDVKEGDEVIYNSKMGHSAEYHLHRKLTNNEVLSIRRKHIYAKL